ncbi:MAG: hypothetical protein KDC27_19395, partial [Acidobacteria bacterium]|nr:hypothetical protein [Acidobacteriota bacterium]
MAPSSLASLFGTDLSQQTLLGGLDADGNLPLRLNGVTVWIDGRPAPLLFVSPTQINFLVPAETPRGQVGVSVTRDEAVAPAQPQMTVQVETVAPAIFQIGVLLHPDRAAAIDAVTYQPGPIVSLQEGGQETSGTYVSLYGTGIRGSHEVSVQLTDRTGNVSRTAALYAGPAPAFLGLDQVNFRVPSELEGAGVVQLRLWLNGQFSNAVSLDLSQVPSPHYESGEYFISAFAGTGSAGFAGDGEASSVALLQSPQDVALARDGSLLIADTGNRVIRRVSPQGKITTFAGTGQEGSDGDGGLAINASFRTPVSVATDGLGNTYVADAADHRVRKIDSHGVIRNFAGVGVSGFQGDGGAAASAWLSSPYGVAVNPLGSVLIADTGNNRVRLVTSDGLIQTIAGTGEPGDSGDAGPAIGAKLDGPTSIAVSKLFTIFLTDSGNRKVRRIDGNGLIYTVVDDPNADSDQGAPLSVTLDPNEQLVLSDARDHHLVVFGLDNQMHPLAGQDWPGPMGDGGPALQAELHSPGGSETNPFGDIFLADAANHKVRVLWRKLGDLAASCGQAVEMAFVPPVVLGGEAVSGLVRLNCPVEADVTVILSSDTPGVPAPASVTIPAGEVVGTFELPTIPVEFPVEVQVTGQGGGGTTTGSVTILPGDGPQIRSLTVTATSVVGGQSTVGRISLGAPAPAGGLLVRLASSDPKATVLSEVLIPEGSIGAEILILTEQVDEPLLVIISGETGDLSASGTLLILPSGDGQDEDYHLVSLVLDSPTVLGGVSATATVTADKPAPEGGLTVFLSANTPLISLARTVVIPEGQTAVTFQVQTFAVDKALSVTLLATHGNTVRASLALQAELGPGQGQISGLTLAPTAVTGGQPSTGTVTLGAPAPAGGVLVSLSSGNASASVPGSLVIPQGQTTGQFTVTTTTVSTQQVAQITAASANTVNAALTINAPTAGQGQIAGLALAPTAVTGGQ